jgi:uncharacterized protein (TIGR02996 family)
VLSTAVAVNPELEARLVDRPEIDTFLVYGDWLVEQGDPRGELVAIQARLIGAPGDRALRAREAQLFAAHRHDWLGALADLPADEFAVSWFCGFVEHARILRPARPPAVHATQVLDALVEIPSAALLRGLEIDVQREATIELAPYLGRIAQHAPGLRQLAIRCPGWAPSTAGGFTKLSPRLARLRRLEIETSDSPRVDTIDIPTLRVLDLQCVGMWEPDFQALLAPRWRELRWLVVDSDHPEVAAGVDDFQRIVRGTFPALRHLGFPGYPFDGVALFEALAASPLLRHLEALDLSYSEINLDGIAVLERHAAAFAHLDYLDLRHAHIPTNAGVALGHRLPCANAVPTELPPELDDIEDYDY